MEDLFQVGVITAPHGVRGEVKVFPTTDDNARMSHGLDLVEGKMNESKKAKIAQPEQAPTDFKVYWVVRPGDEPLYLWKYITYIHIEIYVPFGQQRRRLQWERKF